MFTRNMRGSQFSGRRVGGNMSATLLLSALVAVLCVLPACSIDANNKDKNGETHVDIKSPVGDLHVSEQADIRDSGLALYPGAKPAPKDDSDDKKSAIVNLSLPGFSLKVVAAEFTSDDAPDKIIAYYDKELRKYGKTIQCHGGWNGGQSGIQSGIQSKIQTGIESGIQSGHVTYDGKDDMSKPVACGNDSSGNSVELKVGTEGNQHIVAIKPSNSGSRFALVYVRIHTGSDKTI
jgi:hypothetical protein